LRWTLDLDADMSTKIITPPKTLLEGAEYTSAAATDVMRTWRKYGWLPKEEREAELKAQQTVKRMKTKERNDANS
jgi:hypothetical protein